MRYLFWSPRGWYIWYDQNLQEFTSFLIISIIKVSFCLPCILIKHLTLQCLLTCLWGLPLMGSYFIGAHHQNWILSEWLLLRKDNVRVWRSYLVLPYHLHYRCSGSRNSLEGVWFIHPIRQFWSNPVQFATKEYLGQESDCDMGLQSRIIWAPPDWSRRSQPGRFCRLTSSRWYRQAAVVSTTSFLLSLVNLKPGMPLGPEAFLVAVLMITDCMEKKKQFCQTCSLFFSSRSSYGNHNFVCVNESKNKREKWQVAWSNSTPDKH